MKQFVKARSQQPSDDAEEQQKGGIPPDEFYARLLAATGSSKNKQQKSERVMECKECGLEFELATADNEQSALQEHRKSIAHILKTQPQTEGPSVYGISADNVGFRMLRSQGWELERGLGAEGQGRKYPIPTRLKKDRTGIGSHRTKATISEEDRLRITHSSHAANKPVSKPPVKARSRKDIEQEAAKDRLKRQQIYEYMNQPHNP